MTSYQSYSDEDLVYLLMKDDKPAFEELYKRHWISLYNTVFKRLKNTEQSKDIIQDVFADLWIRRGKVQIDNIRSYLHTAVRYQVFKQVGRRKVSSSFFELFETIATSPFAADNIIAEKELSELAHAWLDSLPGKRKEIFVLHFSQNLTTKEISDRLNISQKTVQNQLGTAMKDLRKTINCSIILLLAFKGLL